MKRRPPALALDQDRDGWWWLCRARQGEAAERFAGPFKTQLEADAERTRLMRSAPKAPKERGPYVPRNPSLARRS